MLSEVATESCPVLVADDLNIHIEKSTDTHALSLLNLLSSYGFSCRVNVPTHELGGTLDFAFSRTDSPFLASNVSDPGLSDRYLVTWPLSIVPPPPIYVSSHCRP